jgi:hypothetical protein
MGLLHLQNYIYNNFHSSAIHNSTKLWIIKISISRLRIHKIYSFNDKLYSHENDWMKTTENYMDESSKTEQNKNRYHCINANLQIQKETWWFYLYNIQNKAKINRRCLKSRLWSSLDCTRASWKNLLWCYLS